MLKDGFRNVATRISVVVPMWNEEGNIVPLYEAVKKGLADCAADFELIFVDDGSTDASSSVVRRLNGDDGRVKLIRLSRNFGQQAALTAGLEVASGDAVITK